MFYSITRAFMRLVLSILRRWQVNGVENVPQQGGLIVVSNHTSYWDPVVIGCALTRRIYFMAKAELFKNYLLSLLIRALCAFPVERGKSDRKAIRKATELLLEGKILGIFPEGTRNDSGVPLEPQLGAALLAFKVGVPILPVGIVGAKGVKEKLMLNFGQPIPLPEFLGSRPSRQVLEEYSQLVMQQVKLMTDEKS